MKYLIIFSLLLLLSNPLYAQTIQVEGVDDNSLSRIIDDARKIISFKSSEGELKILESGYIPEFESGPDQVWYSLYILHKTPGKSLLFKVTGFNNPHEYRWLASQDILIFNAFELDGAMKKHKLIFDGEAFRYENY